MAKPKKYAEIHAYRSTMVETEKAFSLELDNGYMGRGHNGHIWFPKSMCEIRHPEDAAEEDFIIILIPLWLALKKTKELWRIEGYEYTIIK